MSVRLNWTTPPDNGASITGYKVQRRPSGGTWATLADLGLVDNYLDTSAAVGTAYGYRIAAVNSVGVGAYSAESTITTSAAVTLANSTYTASTAIIANPDRGFFQYTETHRRADGTGAVALDSTELAAARTGTTTVNGQSHTGRTIVFRYFYMEAFRETDTIPQAYLDFITADLNAVRVAGCRARLRFAYTDQYAGTGPWTTHDATVSRTLSHVSQIMAAVNAQKDVVQSVDAGFIGTFGEWFYTSTFGSNSDPNILTAQNVEDRNLLIDRLLTTLDSSIFVNLRYVGSRQAYLTSRGTANAGRLGHHNDAFRADAGEYGTYQSFVPSGQTIAQSRAVVAAMPPVPIMGESANYDAAFGSWAQAESDFIANKWSSLNAAYFGAMLTAWGQTNIDTAQRQLGYRIRLVSSALPVNATTGSQVAFTIVLTNDGYAPPFRNRPVQVVFVNGSTVVRRTISGVDVRTWTRGGNVTLTGTVLAPPSAGTWQMHFALPDPVLTRASHAIRTADTTTWDSVNGLNYLAKDLTVTGGTVPDNMTGFETAGFEIADFE